jgi:hypothetical protein
LEASQKVAWEAYPFHPYRVVEQILPFPVHLPYLALEVQAKQEAATEHTCSATENTSHQSKPTRLLNKKEQNAKREGGETVNMAAKRYNWENI